ncbi:uncharacterized protein LOC143565821 [Bidens hawaiensis]|uniref:uncharacterized protein LOC143565821 n=1 Tax=Bidens hawaiensis TaxID=980011 RepID=UPI00404ABD93
MDMVVNLGDKDVRHILHLYAQGNTKAQIEAQPFNTKAHPENQPVKGFTKATANRILTPTKLLLGSTSCTLPIPITNQDFQSEIQVDNGSASEGEAYGSDDGSELEIEEELNLDDDEVWTDDDDDEWRESVAAIKESKLAEKQLVERLLKNFHSEIQVEEAHSDCSSYEDSEGDVNSPGESEDDDIKGKKHKVKVPVVTDYTDWSKWEWVVGTRFPTREAIRNAVRNYAVCNGRNLRVIVSDKNRHGRLGFCCVKDCPFKVYASFHPRKGCFLIKIAINEHTCQRNMLKNRQLTADFIADQFLPIFKAKPHWPAKDIPDAVKEKFKVLITNWMAYKSKTSAQRKLHGSMKDHYCKLGSYLTALKQVNPTSTFKLLTVPSEYYGVDDGVEVFFRLFVCFDPLKQGFLAGCRKLLCLDDCFLKTFLGGMLLAAIGRDANDQMSYIGGMQEHIMRLITKLHMKI